MANEGKPDYTPDSKKIDLYEGLSKRIAREVEQGLIFDLDLTAELKQSGIVSSFVFKKKMNSIIVTLNHNYNGKVVISPINNTDWSKTQDNFEKRLKNRRVDKDHILQLSDVLDNNHERILRTFDDDSDKQQKEKLPITRTKKYTKDDTSSFEDWYSKLVQKYQDLYDVVNDNLPNLWHSLEFELAILKILNIKDCTLPFAGIVLGRPSSLKTVGIELFRKETDHTYYTDSFSAKSFVSHSMGVPKEQLQEIDMLPKIKNKCFLTPELAPTFAAKDDDLVQVLGIMTRILDGHGYESDTGAHGHRGYNEKMMFTWIGAAVDIPYKVHKLLTTLGPKLYFLRVPKVDNNSISDEDYYSQVNITDFGNKIRDIEVALFDYLDWFDICPNLISDEEEPSPPKIQWDFDRNEKQAVIDIIKLARLLAYLRGVVPTWHTQDTQGSEYAYGLPIIEEPDRAMTVLYNLARGHALSRGRNYVTMEDIPLIVKVVLSTASIERVTIFDLLLADEGKLTTSQIEVSLNVSKPTALRTMTELKALGLVDMDEVKESKNDQVYSVMQIKLKDYFNWFLEDEFKRLREGFKPTDNNNDSGSENNEKIVVTKGENFLTQLSVKGEEEQRKEKTPLSDIKNNDYSCYYCDYQTNNNKDYERHVVNIHGLGHPCYPTKPDMEKFSLKPQGKEWEK